MRYLISSDSGVILAEDIPVTRLSEVMTRLYHEHPEYSFIECSPYSSDLEAAMILCSMEE